MMVLLQIIYGQPEDIVHARELTDAEKDAAALLLIFVFGLMCAAAGWESDADKLSQNKRNKDD